MSHNDSRLLLSLDGASCGYGSTTVLRDVHLRVREGEAVALLGSNGAGKSTLLKGIAGLATLRGPHTLDATLGYVSQHQDSDPTFPITAARVVEMGLYSSVPWWVRAGSMRSYRPRVLEALARVGMEEHASARLGELSGGQRQRVFIARALVAQPDLVLMDEPFNGLDQSSRRILLDIITGLKEEGVALLVSTHDPLLAQRTCDAGALVVDGRVEVHDTDAAVDRYLEATSVLREGA
ncbi:ATP-binding cassette domain-containing protein [uncultured Corynebacterium sp.]|uniref:metal ABC transporter ATP-binding protein n=1 Tax=uncultured Corynebacterium sp. TaxID=159447 RepID=UPI0025FE8550|nr:ATP-binding cassette domain-containing protein [uncultured Corynebacterium sp.]